MNDGTPLTLGRSIWAVDPRHIRTLIEARWNQAQLEAAFAARLEPAEPEAVKSDNPGGTVAVIPLTGVLTPHMSLLSLLFGGGGNSLQDFRDQFQAAVRSPDVGSIVLDVDSPGGVIDQIPETAAEVAAARGTKPIVAVSNSMAASAAYWIASQADEVVVTPSGSVGSIGVYMTHTDHSERNAKEGIKTTYISAGKYKVEGNRDSPLSKEAQEDWQAEAYALYGMFVDAVAEGRKTSVEAVREGYGQGRTMVASRALEAGLVDRVATIQDVIGGLLTSGPPPAAAASHVATNSMPMEFVADGRTWIFDTTSGHFVNPTTSSNSVEPVEDTPDVDEPEEDETDDKVLPFDLEFAD